MLSSLNPTQDSIEKLWKKEIDSRVSAIEADKVESVGAGVLRLTLGTIMASKGVIFLYQNEIETKMIFARLFHSTILLSFRQNGEI